MSQRSRCLGVLVLTIIGLVISGCTLPALPGTDRQRTSPPPATPSARPRVAAGTTSPTTPSTPFPDDLPGGDPRGLTPAQKRVDRDDPDAVAAAFVVRLQLWDTELDRRPNDAARRAVPYATPQLRAAMLSSAPVAAPGDRWAELAGHHGWTTVTTESGGVGEDAPTTDTTAVRAVTPDPLDHGDDGWISHPDPPGTYIVTLARVGKGRPWAVSSYTIQ